MKELTAKQISESRYKYRNPYAHLDSDGNFSAIPNRPMFENPGRFHGISFDSIRRRAIPEKTHTPRRRYTNRDIEKLSITLQRLLWENRANIWTNDISDPIIVLDPMRALEVMGFSVESNENLGQFDVDGAIVEVAGIIDYPVRKVSISSNFPPNIRRFTCAHELGHALLHQENTLHRDRPLDGSQYKSQRDNNEIEADKFASYFLMPEKLVRELFSAQFKTSCFSATRENLFALKPGKERILRSMIRAPRDLSRLLAKARHFDGEYFDPLADQFGVSIEAMAIRLEELGCIAQDMKSKL